MKRLKLFSYRKEDCQLEPNANYRPVPILSRPNPEWFETAAEPAQADFIVFPVCLTDVGASHAADPDYVYSYLPRLPLFQEFEEKHVFFLPGVDTWAPLFTRAVVFRHSVHRKFPDLNAVAYPYYPEQPPEPLDYNELVYHTVFAGFVGSWSGRVELVRALSQAKNLNCWWKVSERYHHHLPPGKQAENLKAYREGVRRSVTVCCPRGAGLNSIRFFETLAMGRLPVLISDDGVLPLADQIEYDQFVLHLPEARIAEIGSFLLEWFGRTPAMEIARRCSAARQAWESLLSPARQEHLVVHSLHRVKSSKYRLNGERAGDVAALRSAMAGS